MKLWTSLVSPRWLNNEFSVSKGDEPKVSSPSNSGEDRGFRLAISFQSLEYRELKSLIFSYILLNTKGHRCDIDGCDLSNTDALELNVAWSPLSLLASSVVVYYMSDCSSLRCYKIFTGWGGT